MPTYRATRNADGRYAIFDVPVLGPMAKGERGLTSAIDREWLKAALEKATQRLGEGYRPPVHLNHHSAPSSGQWTPRVGFMHLRRVGDIEVGGETVPALFADIEDVDEGTFREIAASRFPYRSVEILDPESREVDSLALLDDRVPHFRFPNLEVTLHGTQTVAPMGMPAIAAAAEAGKGVEIVGRFVEPSIRLAYGDDDEKKKRDGDGDGKTGEDAKPFADADKGEKKMPDQTADSQAGADGGGSAKMLDLLVKIAALLGIQTQDTSPMQGQALPKESPAPTGAVEPWQIAAQAKAKEVLAAAQAKPGSQSAAAKPQESIVPDTTTKPDEKPAASTVSPEMADLAGEAAARRAALAAHQGREAVLKLAADAKKRLLTAGYFIDPDSEKDLEKFAAQGKDSLDRFVTAFERVGPKDGPSTLAAADAGGMVTFSDEPKEILALAAKHSGKPAVLAAAREASAEFDTLNARSAMRLSREKYIENHPKVREAAK